MQFITRAYNSFSINHTNLSTVIKESNDNKLLDEINYYKNLPTNLEIFFPRYINKGTIHKNPILTCYGLPVFEKEDFKYGLIEEIYKTTKIFSLKNIKQEENIVETLKKVCRKYSKEKTGKKPITNVNLIRI